VGVSPNPLFDVPGLDKSLDLWNMMDYDMSGSWSTATASQSNLMGASSIDTGVQAWLAANVASDKLIMGIPLYGHVFEGTTGLGGKFSAIGTDDGLQYSLLPKSGAKVTEDLTNGVSYSYDSSAQEFVTYDTPGVVGVKAAYVVKNKLGGTMYWETSGDKTGSDSLIGTAAKGLGSLDSTQNHLNFPNSKYASVKSVAGSAPPSSTPPPSGGGEDTSTAPAPTSTPPPSGGGEGTSTEPVPTSTPPANTGSCAAKRRRA